MSAWPVWLVLLAPLVGVGVVSLTARPSWPRALGAAAVAGVLAMALSLSRAGFMVAGPRAVVGGLAGRPSPGDFAEMLLWAAGYAVAVGAVATGAVRAATRRHSRRR